MTGAGRPWTGNKPAAPSRAYQCPDCRGPSRTFKGTHHGWRCGECVDRVIGLDRQPAARSVLEGVGQEGVSV